MHVVGFRSTGGTDMNHKPFDVIHLFENTVFTYNSCISPNIIATGICMPYDRERFNRLQEFLWKLLVERDEKPIESLDIETSKKQLFFKFFIRMMMSPSHDHVLSQIEANFSRNYRSWINRLRVNGPTVCTRNSTDPSHAPYWNTSRSQELRNRALFELQQCFEIGFDYADIMANTESVRGLESIKVAYPHYLEHDIERHLPRCRDFLGSFSEVRVSRDGAFTCPIECLAIFVHDQDFERKELDQVELFRIFDNVTSVQQVLELYNTPKGKAVMPGISRTSLDGDNSQMVDCHFVEFKAPAGTHADREHLEEEEKHLNGAAQTNRHGVRVVAWMRFVGKSQTEMRLTFKNRVASRFVSANLISCDNRLEEYNDQHNYPNIDVKYISLRGNYVPSLLMGEPDYEKIKTHI